jgi:hypothetical protein
VTVLLPMAAAAQRRWGEILDARRRAVFPSLDFVITIVDESV